MDWCSSPSFHIVKSFSLDSMSLDFMTLDFFDAVSIALVSLEMQVRNISAVCSVQDVKSEKDEIDTT